MRKIVDTTPEVGTMGRIHRHWYFAKLSPKSTLKVQGINTDPDKIDAFDVHKAYKLKGFEFGNWLNQNDRYDKLIACDASLGELAKILGTTNVGINGKIGVAFGARGMSKALAHYESSTNMINLTKIKGDGCLAHEYGHAIDNIIGMYYDQNKDSAYLSGGSSTQKVGTYTGGIFRALVNTIVDKYKASESIKRLPKGLGSDYWHRRTECFARMFEQYIGYVLGKKGTQNEFLSSTYTQYCGSKVYMTDAEFKQVIPLFDKLCKAIGEILNGKSITIKVTAEDIAIAAKTKTKKTETKVTKEEKKELAKTKKATKKKATTAKVVNKDVKASVQAAIADVLTLKKYAGIKPLSAGVLFSKYKDTDTYEISGDFENAIFSKLNDLGLVTSTKYDSRVYRITGYGKELIKAIKGRKNTLTNIRFGAELFAKR